MRQNTCCGDPYRSRPASSSAGSRLATRALTVTTTKLMQNIVCARMIVVMSFGTPAARNCAARPAPSTTSGVAIGRNSSRLIAERARNR